MREFLALKECLIMKISDEIIQGEDDQLDVVVYPNPNNGYFTLMSSIIQGNTVVEIYNLIGKKVFESPISLKSTELDISHQPKGVYLLKVSSGDKQYTERIVIQ